MKDPSPMKNPTLIVCPLSVMSAWQNQVANHVHPGLLNVLLYHSTSRISSESELGHYDIVITTYQTLASEQQSRDNRKRKKSGFLHNVNWHRIVLDEGHYLRNMKTSMFQACDALQGKYRWFLSGTPISNSVADIESAVRFLRLEPFSSDEKLYSRYITRPIKANDFDAVVKLRTLMKVIALRRRKQTVVDRIAPKKEILVSVELSLDEREAYDAISAAISDFLAHVRAIDEGNGNEMTNNSGTILGLITRLRQCCLDFSLVPAQSLVSLLAIFRTSGLSKGSSSIQRLSKDAQKDLFHRFKAMFARASGATDPSGIVEREDDHVECCICLNMLDESESTMFSICKHALCSSCVDQLFSSSSKVKCPLCRVDVNRQDCVSLKDLEYSIKEADLGSKNASDIVTSTRSSKTIEILNAVKQIRQKRNDEKVQIIYVLGGKI